MKHKKFRPYNEPHTRHYVILETGDEILAKLKEFAREESVSGASISGIGTLKDPELGFFDLGKREYKKKIIKGEFELLSLSGNISQSADGTIVHLHALISDEEFKAFGGHLFSGVITGTAEIVIETLGEKVERKYDEKTRLNLIQL